MAWIKTVAEHEAQGRVAEIYAQWSNLGFVPNIVKALSFRPEVLECVAPLSRTVTFGGSRLGRVREEMIATVVSAINRCHY
jgi:alkylhydroperoxidase family enzyme